jgi:hypothetical protein
VRDLPQPGADKIAELLASLGRRLAVQEG